MSARYRPIVPLLLVLTCASPSWSIENLLDDPGFERYHYDSGLGCYVPNADSPWKEYGYGIGSVRNNGVVWTAPEEMARERPLGFTPSGGGYTGPSLGQNRGVLYWRQDVIDPAKIVWGRDYEAWVWLGGLRRDNDTATSGDSKEERGGWRILWYDNTNTASWTEENALQIHMVEREFHGAAGQFVRLYGWGLTPILSRGFRFEAFARSWTGDPPGISPDTRVAIDNAHYGILPYKLNNNPQFEDDVVPGSFVGWTRPDPWFNLPDTLAPQGQLMPQGYKYLRPYRPQARAYGYFSYFQGWINGGFSFGQNVNIASFPAGSEFGFSFYWYQNSTNPHRAEILRRPMARVRLGLECLSAAGAALHTHQEVVTWPYSTGNGNTSSYDNNNNQAYCHYVPLRPPAGTTTIAMHIYYT